MPLHYSEGTYLFRIAEQGWTETSKEPKRPMLVFKGDPIALIVTDQDGTESHEEIHRDQYDRRIFLTIDDRDDRNMDFAMRKLRGAGFTGETFASLNLVGRDVRARCTHGTYKDRPTENWDFDLPQVDVQAIDSSLTRKLDALFGKRLKNGASPKPEPVRSTVVPAKESHRASVEAQRPLETVPHDRPPDNWTPNDEVPF